MMTTIDLGKLARVLDQEREAVLALWRQRVRQLPSAAHLDAPTLDDHIPGLLREVVEALATRSEAEIADTVEAGTSPGHGMQRYRDGFDVEEVVAEYSIMRGCIHDLAESFELTLQGEPFQILNHVIDSAIALAVETYARHQAIEVERRRAEYLAFVAHDLRTPLNAISLAARLLEQTTATPDGAADTQRVLATLHRNVNQLQRLIAQVLEESANLSSEAGVKLERRTFELWPLVETMIRDLAPVAQKHGTRLVNDVPSELVVFADAGALQRVLQNLVANAIEHTPRGSVVISARELDREGGVECRVTDDGAGIPPERLERILHEERTPPEGQGAGLGLEIVRTYVEAHEGRLIVESRPGAGSTFRFTLPGRDAARLNAPSGAPSRAGT